MKKISVILTTYNSGENLARTIDSVFNQIGVNKEFEIEFIAIDDCSTDGTPDLIKKYNDINFISTTSNSGGPNKGRNIGLKEATGDFICIMDHDDIWHPNKIISQLSVCNLAPIISCGHTIIDDCRNRTFSIVNKPKGGNTYNIYKRNVTFLSRLSKSKKGQQTYIGGIMFQGKFKSMQFENRFGMTDFDWLIRLFENNVSAEICESLYDRHVSRKNLSLDEDYRMKDFDYSLMTIKKYENEYPKQVKLSYKRIHGSRARYCYLIGNMEKARSFFWKSGLSVKIFLYYFTTFAGYKLVKKYFNVFG